MEQKKPENPVDKEELVQYCLNAYKLRGGRDPREELGLEWLLDKTGRRVSYPDENRLHELKTLLLCMDTASENYGYLDEGRKEMAKKLMENEDVVDTVIATLFQWFGSNIGSYDIGKLMDKIRAYQEKETE